jgi:signal transduction histidine kinase
VLLVSRSELLLPDYLFEGPSPHVSSPVGIGSLAPLASVAEALYGMASMVLVAAVVLLVLRYRRAEDERRLQIKWLALAGLVAAAAELLQALLRASGVVSASTLDSLYIAFTAPAIFAFLAAILIALFRYRLFDIDVVIRRSLVYAGLSVVIGAAYLGIAAALGIAAGSRFPIGVAVLVTIAATLGFQPLRQRVDRLAGRWILGEQMTGYELLSRFGETLEHAFDIGELAPQIATSVREGLRLRWVRVQLATGAEANARLEPAGAAGIGLDVEVAPALEVPLVHGGERVGSIECGPKVEGRFDEADRELLATLARQAALAIHNAWLASELAARLDEINRQAAELAASRARIVHAQDVERRRIERNIHDGVQQEIVALAAKLRLARNELRRDPRSADAALAALQQETRQTLDDLRELARGIHPTVLSDRGLLEAIESRAARLPSSVTIRSDRAMRGRRFAEEIEAAAYFVVSEGLANAIKHAAPTSIQVALSSRDGTLVVEVSDNGGGFEPGASNGSGLVGLRDRVEALGGTICVESGSGRGTRVIAEFPALVAERVDA